MYRRSLEILIKVSRDFIDEGSTNEKGQVRKSKKKRGEEIDTTCLAGRKLPLITPHYDKLVRESEVKFDISRWAMCILNFTSYRDNYAHKKKITDGAIREVQNVVTYGVQFRSKLRNSQSEIRF